MTDMSISEPFEAVSASHLAAILSNLGLKLNQPIIDLLSHNSTTSEVLKSVAEYIIDNGPERHLGQIVPILQQDSQELLPLHVFSTRSANGLRKNGVSSWGDLSRLTPADLLELPALGRKSVAEIIAVALHRAANLLPHASEGAEATLSEAPRANIAGSVDEISTYRSFSGLDMLARWALCIGNATTIGQALDLAASHILPPDVASALNSFKRASIESTLGEGPAVNTAYDSLWAECSERQREILQQRISLQGPTLRALAEHMHLTPERVRQIQKTAEAKVSSALQRPQCAEIRWRAAQLHQELGTAISWASDTAREALSAATRGILQDSATAEAVLLWLAGPYRLNEQTGWIFAEKEYLLGKVGPGSEIGPPPRPSLVDVVTNDDGVVDIEAARNRALAAGLVSAAIDDWVALCPFREFDRTLVRWLGSVADKAEAVLGMLKRPAAADEVNSLIGEGHNIRGVRDRLLDDDRFVRTDRFRLGLRRWGLEEYTGIVDEIEEEIERRGGEADVHELVEAITKQFNLRSSSVLSYTAAPRFVVNRGRIHVRRPDEPFIPTRTLFDEARAFLLDENRCIYRVRIDGDLLRGSGRPLPQGVGAWLGVLPGTRRQFRFRDDDILLISWPESALLGPALGSLRRQAIARSAEAGDSLLLEFDRSSDRVDAMLVRESELDAATGWLRGTLLTGIDAGDQQEFDALLVRAVGASSVAELRRRCRNRGDPELATLVQAEESSELDDALERLKELL